MDDDKIGYDLTFELNEFNEPRIRSDIETLKNTVLFILFSKPGQYPSLPMIGMNIENMLYSYYDEIEVSTIRATLKQQCSALGVYFDDGSLNIAKIKYQNHPTLLIHIEGTEKYPQSYRVGDKDNSKYLIGISIDELNGMIYNINKR